MLKRQLSVLLIVLLLFAMAIPATAQTGTPTAGGLVVPVTGTAGPAGRVTGTFTVLQFVDLNGALGAAGKLAITTARGDTIVTNAVTASDGDS